MKTLKFKTNINCSGCIAKVTPSLNQAIDILKWEVDTSNPQKVLTIQTKNLEAHDVLVILKNIGYTAEIIGE
jgi:copper chaperone